MNPKKTHKPQKAPKVPKYRRQPGSKGDRAFVVLNGARHYLGAYDSAASRQAYHRLVAEFLANDGRLSVPTEQVTMVELLNAFRKHAEKRYRKPDGSPTGEQANYRSLLKTINDLYADTLVDDFRGPSLLALRAVMVQKGWSRRYVNRQVVRVRTIFKWGVAQGMVAPDTHAALCAVEGLREGQTNAPDHPPVMPVTDEQIEAVLPLLPQVVVDMIQVQRLTGMRPGELCALTASDIDQDDDVWTYRPTGHKTRHRGRGRQIPIGPQAQAILAGYLSRRPKDATVFSPIEAQAQRRAQRHAARKTPLSCGNRPGTNRVRRRKLNGRDYYTAETYARAIRYACEAVWPHPTIKVKDGVKLSAKDKAELKAWNDKHRWAPNQLRHTAGTFVRSEAGLEVARAFLGHSTFSVTEAYYAEADMAKLKELMRKVG